MPEQWWPVEFEGKPDFEMAMKRVYAWYNGEMLDRPPVRFYRHNAGDESVPDNSRWRHLKNRWFDVGYQIESFLASIKGKTFHGETFPVFWPNLGPNVYAAFYGGTLEFGDVTSWINHPVKTPEDVERLHFDPEQNFYFQKIEELTRAALTECDGKFLVGYTDLHPGLDCVADWRNPETLCTDFYDHPEMVEQLVALSMRDFERIYNRFDAMLKEKRQLSVSWLNIPSFGKMHIPSCDFSTMISPKLYQRYGMPILRHEVRLTTHNIFHLDGKGVARHLDEILKVPEIQAIQWVQSAGTDQPIIPWLPLIKKIQRAGKGVVVDMKLEELEPFINEMNPKGLFLCLPARAEEEELAILKRLERWLST
ncbi:trimethylamine corrinoid protein 2 [Candidatus Moduliflexus flocculans]|uniref:Trimethylamine corrinoid protein 2 n=1 Tax=Candidatus Moduliflexus flocculans TaxID=1499966 RepID=A0A0S6VPU8_9BACT|nr:trimethylamine corrinoid protein 2 [Candidatus Moduliflexus flocculans]